MKKALKQIGIRDKDDLKQREIIYINKMQNSKMELDDYVRKLNFLRRLREESHEFKTCPICWNEMLYGKRAVFVCGHMMCESCFQDFSKKTQSSHRRFFHCPQCRTRCYFEQSKLVSNGRKKKDTKSNNNNNSDIEKEQQNEENINTNENQSENQSVNDGNDNDNKNGNESDNCNGNENNIQNEGTKNLQKNVKNKPGNSDENMNGNGNGNDNDNNNDKKMNENMEIDGCIEK